MKSLSLHEQFERYRREDQAKEADRQRRIDAAKQDFVHWLEKWGMVRLNHHAEQELDEMLRRYIP